MDFPDIGLREMIMIAVAAAALYLLVALVRIGRLSRRRRLGPAAAKQAAAPAEPKPSRWSRWSRWSNWLPRLKRLRRRKSASEDLADEAAGARAAAKDSRTAEFGQELFRFGVESEMQQLRGEVAALKEELKLMKAARRVSPQYNEAMMLAQRGMDAQSVANQCGISVGEAELVLALSRNKQEYEDYGENDPSR